MDLLVWERREEKKKSEKESLWISVQKRKRLQPCNHRKWQMTFQTHFVPYSNPCCELPNQSPVTTSFSSFPFSRKQMQTGGRTFSAWPIHKIGYIFQGQVTHVTLEWTRCMRAEIKSVGCRLMESGKRFQRSSINTAGLLFDTFYLHWC